MVRRRHLPGNGHRGTIQRGRRRIFPAALAARPGVTTLASPERSPVWRVAVPTRILLLMNRLPRHVGVGAAVLLLLALTACRSGSADNDPASAPPTLHPVEVTAVRWLVDRTVPDVENVSDGCRCAEPSRIARETPADLGADCSAICLTARGLLIARMSATFTNGPGADLRVYELGTQHSGTDDRFSVYVSGNGHEWVLVAESVHNDPDRSYASIDLGETRGDLLFVKIVPATDDGLRTTEGPEILAIEALHPSVGLGS